MNIGLVSVIMPAYNCQKYIGDSITSVLNQTYRNLELIITDDCSTDGTGKIIRSFADADQRIVYIRNSKNCGAAISRNNSIEKAHGSFLAFLDADDIWRPEKLELQLRFMISVNAVASCTSYGKIDECSNVLKKRCIARKVYYYTDILKTCPGNSTIIYNCEKAGKILGPNIEVRNDLAMFLKIIKKIGVIYGFNDVLGYHRVRKESLSSNKLRVVKYQWKVYYELEHLGAFKSIYYVFYKIMQTLLGRNG